MKTERKRPDGSCGDNVREIIEGGGEKQLVFLVYKLSRDNGIYKNVLTFGVMDCLL